MRGLNVTGYTMFIYKGIRPRAAILLSRVDAWRLVDHVHDDLGAITARLEIARNVREVMICSANLFSMSRYTSLQPERFQKKRFTTGGWVRLQLASRDLGE